VRSQGSREETAELIRAVEAGGLSRRELLRRGTALGLGAPLMGALLAACGGSDSGGGGGGGGGGGAKSLGIAIGAEPGNLDPLIADDGQRDAFNWNVYEGLTTRLAENAGEVAPLLAESWEASGKQWTFKLRKDVKFHDGSPMTADDVVASYTKMLDPKSKSELASSRLAGVKAVRKVDDSTVVIETEKPDPIVPARATVIAIAPKSLAVVGDKRMSTEMLGTGPYKFNGWKRGSAIALERFADYWGEKPQITTVSIRFMEEDSVRLSALLAKEIQIARNMPPDLSSRAPKVASAPVSEVSFVRMNAKASPVLKDHNVREAVNLAIDRQSLIKNVYGGFAEPANGILTAPFVPGSDAGLQDYPYDPEKAKSLLDAAGVNGPVSFSGPTGRWLKDRETSEAIVSMLQKAGFQVKPQFPVFSKWLEQLFAAQANPKASPDLMYIGHGNELIDPEQTFGLYISCKGEASGYCNPKVQALGTRAATVLDTKERDGIYHEMWKTLYDDDAYASIATMKQIHFTAENVKWTPRQDAFVLFKEISI
jgi:peptide/nickel transport system substrate-binding protein